MDAIPLTVADLDPKEPWMCEHCGRTLPLCETAVIGDTLEIVCEECHEKHARGITAI